MRSGPGDGDSLRGGTTLEGFAEQILAVIDEGRRTATYKLALLMALIDCCAERTTRTGDAPVELSTRTIARRMAELYWPQLRPFPAPTGPIDLRQITNKSATIVRVMRTLFDSLPGALSWQAAESMAPDQAERVLDVVEHTVARFPLVRLQTIDGVPRPFLYDIDWGEGVTLSRLQAPGGGRVPFRHGASDQLLRLTPLVRPLIELHWIRMVAGLNRLDVVEDDLRRHLFGGERVPFPASLRRGLLDLQAGACLYCTAPLSAGLTAVDHFIPWSRWPNDALENLVLAHAACNAHKSDHVPGPRPLGLWVSRLEGRATELDSLAIHVPWRAGSDKTVSLARSMYAHLPEGSPLWDGPGQVSALRRHEVLELLAAV